MTKAISFSLWGNLAKYTTGAIQNVYLAKHIYPKYKIQFYVDNLVPQGIIFQLEDLDAEIIYMNCIGDYRGMFWRMESINKFDLVLIRDCDSRIDEREKYCIDEFIESDKLFHSIHDHPFHDFPVMPGLMAFKRSKVDFKKLLSQYNSKDMYGIDYLFYKSIFPLIEKDLFTHDEFCGRGKKINYKRDGLNFCGQVFDEKNQPNKQHQEVLRKCL